MSGYWYDDPDWDDHHPACRGGCGQLADECECPMPNPLGSMRVTTPIGSPVREAAS